ncbi:transposase [soil metagenome]
MLPLAYHLTWTAYGTWLHGDSRGWIETGAPCIMRPDEARHLNSLHSLTEAIVEFDGDQRQLIEQTIECHCHVRKWKLHACNARSNHVHVVVTADNVKPETVIDQFKLWCSTKLSDAAGLPSGGRAKKAGRRKWFTEHGSTKWINDEDYLHRAIEYVNNQ